MNGKLKTFHGFSASILPNEAKYLETQYQFVDGEKLDIIKRVIANALSQTTPKPFDVAIDKRKYSYIKKWVEKKLTDIDVDANIGRIMFLNQQILTDAITSDDERQFLNYIASYKTIDFNFHSLYELAKEYKSYLLVRMRYKDHQIVSDFISTFKPHYEKAQDIKEKLYDATTQITNQYTLNNTDTMHWEAWLMEVFQDAGINGKNRYQAFVLLAFMHTNYNEPAKLKLLFDQIDVYFSQGQMYSRRLLSNYYASRVLLHSRQDELKEAEFYGYLSIRQNNSDTLMYLNNLVAILLRNNKPEKAFLLLENHKALYKETHNYHQKIGYCSYQIRVLSELHKNELAETTAKNFLKKYRKEVLKHRWHHFFTSYISILIVLEKYDEVLRLSNKYNLIQKEEQRQKQSNYVPNISWSISLSKYMEGQINSARLLDEIKAPIVDIETTTNQKQLMIKVIDKLSKNLPQAFLKLKSYI